MHIHTFRSWLLQEVSEVGKRIAFSFLIKSFVAQFLFDHVVTKNSHFTRPLGWKEHLYYTWLEVHSTAQKCTKILHQTIICKAALNVRIKRTFLHAVNSRRLLWNRTKQTIAGHMTTTNFVTWLACDISVMAVCNIGKFPLNGFRWRM